MNPTITITIQQNGQAPFIVTGTKVDSYTDVFKRYDLPMNGVTLRAGSRTIELDNQLIENDHVLFITKKTDSAN